jgi:hypothetical protein
VITNRECHEKCVLFAPQWFFDFCTAFKRAMDIQDNVYLTPADNRDDLVRIIVAV